MQTTESRKEGMSKVKQQLIKKGNPWENIQLIY